MSVTTHDASLNSVREILADSARMQQQLIANQMQTDAEIAKTQTMIQDLIRAIAAEHSNGKGKG